MNINSMLIKFRKCKLFFHSCEICFYFGEPFRCFGDDSGDVIIDYSREVTADSLFCKP